jgi:hypothetical protein
MNTLTKGTYKKVSPAFCQFAKYEIKSSESQVMKKHKILRQEYIF